MTKAIRDLTVSRVSDTDGYEYRATFTSGSGSFGRYGSTANKALEKIRADFPDSRDLTAQVVKTRSYCGKFADGSDIVIDANGIICQTGVSA
jgi:hypothetical protein